MPLTTSRKLFFAFVLFLGFLATLEGMARWVDARPSPPALHNSEWIDFNGPVVLWGGPYLFKLNPANPHFSPYGLRERPHAIPKPENEERVLIVGDSVTFGIGLWKRETFASLVEKKLRSQGADIAVINAGVPMYTPYNELKYYQAEGKSFQARTVVVQFCFNDVVDPQLHWTQLSERDLRDIPLESIPNMEYHRDHVPPLLTAYHAMGEHQRRLDRIKASRLLWLTAKGMMHLLRPECIANVEKEQYVNVGGKRWPVYLTREDSKSIRVFLDYQSPEWIWLRSMYSQFLDATRGNGARLILVFVPLAYQLEEGYPFQPSGMFRRFCAEQSITCLDLYPTFRKHSKDLFLPDDIWHLSAKGHQVVADELSKLLPITHR